MCGIAGILTTKGESSASLQGIVESMSGSIRHRGPDDSGTWVDETCGIAFGFRRLAIIDLTEEGHQPMRSASGRFMMVFNGEVYNYLEIRLDLERAGVGFRGHSDTEVILAAFEQWGIEAAVQRFVGMFAIAAWDSEARVLSLIRDRLGIKPVYYWRQPGRIAFASELRAIAAIPGFSAQLSESGLDAYLRYLYIPAPETIYQDVFKLLPGHILTINGASGQIDASRPFWSVDRAYAASRANPFEGSDADAVEELRRLLSDAVALRMRSDVPVGALLSGGIDSSTVVALMQASSSRPARTFTIGFPGTQHDESTYAARMAQRLGTDHTELAVTGEDALSVVPMLPEVFDEPFADPSLIPTYLVCKLARQDVTVALTGDGGDEVFAGYERYVHGEPLIAATQRVPRPLRRLIGAGFRKPTTQFWDRAYGAFAPVIDRAGRRRLVGQKIRKFGDLLAGESEGGMYETLLSAGWQHSPLIPAHRSQAPSIVGRMISSHADIPLLDRMQSVDQQTYLPDDLLAKVDRASMAVSLEARVPLLDHRVVEFGWRLDRRYKIRDGGGKWILRQVLRGLVGDDLVDRPKVGFSVPIAAWLRGPLRGYAQDLIFARTPEASSWFSPAALRSTWNAFQAGADENALALWTVVMFEAWKERWL
jgi:asparagine synthase (glutamine-hydrolysing)